MGWDWGQEGPIGSVPGLLGRCWASSELCSSWCCLLFLPTLNDSITIIITIIINLPSHPHGDSAVYDALVRLAQPFSTNVPLIDGHGNFGSIDADPAAAMRYTECRLTRLASETLLDDINMDTVQFLPNFDGSEYEPAVLPAKVPILLLNGGAGIAVGMATNVPPHNLGELMDACVHMVKGRNDGVEINDAKLLNMVPGPDFPVSFHWGVAANVNQ